MTIEDKTQRLNFNCPEGLADAFKRETAEEACTMSQVLLRLVTEYVQGRLTVREATKIPKLPDWARIGMEVAAASDEPESTTPALEAGMRPGEMPRPLVHEASLPSRLL